MITIRSVRYIRVAAGSRYVRVLVVAEAGLKDAWGVGGGSIVLASEEIEDVVAVRRRTRDGRVADLEAEDARAHEADWITRTCERHPNPSPT